MKFDLEKIAKRINDSYPFFLCTIKDDAPTARPFGGVAPVGDKLVLLTVSQNVCQQIEKNPNVEIIGILNDLNTWTRVSGKASISDDEKYKEAVLEYVSLLNAYFKPGEEALKAILVEVTGVDNYPEDAQLPNFSDRESLIFLLRHAESQGNVDNIITGGDVDTPLTEEGREMAIERADTFAGPNLEAVYSSPNIRALDTAKLVTSKTDLDVYIDDRLTERLLGILDKAPMFHADDTIFHYDLPFSEPPENLFDRVDKAIREISSKHDGDVLVVSHGAALGTWLSKITGNEYLAFRNNLSCAIIDGNTLEFLGIDFDDEAIKTYLNRKK